MPSKDNARPLLQDRSDLYHVLDEYLAALKAKDPTRLTWAPFVTNVENNVALMVGDGLWGTISGLGSYDLRFADPQTGQVGFFGAVSETTATSPFALRLQVTAGRISEVESIIVRAADSGIKFPDPVFEHKAVLNDIVSPARRRPRERMISIADGYFDTLQLNDGALFTQFWDTCNRVENGVQTTNNSQLTLIPTAKLGCAEQFKLGTYRYDDRLRGRRYPLIDEERGLVLAAAFIDHAGRLGSYRLADGTPAESPVRRPHSFYLLELFKINDGKIEQIEAAFITVPYYMPSPFDE
jgi:hypothetical protein